MSSVRIFVLVSLATTVLSLCACERVQTESASSSRGPTLVEPVTPRAKPESTVDLALQVDDMVCNGCANDVREALMAVPGVVEVSVALETKRVTVTVDAKNAPDAAGLCKALTDAGHEAKVVEATPTKS